MAGTNLYSFTMKTIDGQDKPLSEYKGKTLLIVNTASKCGFTPQYEGFQKLYEQYKDRGFEVLGFPANNFMWQEPGTDAQIKEFCSLKYRVTFPVFSKISVKGKDIHPLYKYLTTESGFNGGIAWNFNKFLINRDGKVAARFGSKTDPLSPELTNIPDHVRGDTLEGQSRFGIFLLRPDFGDIVLILPQSSLHIFG